MRKINFLFAAFLSLTLVAQSQIPAKKPVSTTYRPGTDTMRLADIRERLVQMALQNPEFEIADRKVILADYQLRMAKNDWLSVVTAQANLNETTVKPRNANQGLFYPLYNVAIGIPFNFFGQRMNTVKAARQNLLISQAEKNEHYRKIRAAVLSKYEDYLMFKAKLERQSRITQDSYLNYRQKEKDFQDGLIMIEDYSKAFQTYSQQQDMKDEAQRNLNITKIEMEAMIGGSLDDVLGKK